MAVTCSRAVGEEGAPDFDMNHQLQFLGIFWKNSRTMHTFSLMLQIECRMKLMLKDKTFVQTNVSHQHSAPPSKLRCAVKKSGLATDDLVEIPHHSSKLVFTLRSQYKCVWDCMHLISFEVHWEYFGWNGLTDYDDSSRKFPVTRLIADLWAAIENVMAGHRNLFKT